MPSGLLLSFAKANLSAAIRYKVKFDEVRCLFSTLCAALMVQKPFTREQLRWHIWPTFPLNYFVVFTEVASTFSILLCKKVKNDQNFKARGGVLQGRTPFKSYLLNFFCLKGLENMKNVITMCACAVVVALETQKCRKKDTSHRWI